MISTFILLYHFYGGLPITNLTTVTNPAPAKAIAVPMIAHHRAFLALPKRLSFPAEVRNKIPAHKNITMASDPMTVLSQVVIAVMRSGKELIHPGLPAPPVQRGLGREII